MRRSTTLAIGWIGSLGWVAFVGWVAYLVVTATLKYIGS